MDGERPTDLLDVSKWSVGSDHAYEVRNTASAIQTRCN